MGPGGLKYEFRVGPGADPTQIRLQYSGVSALGVEASGSLLLRTLDPIRKDAKYPADSPSKVPLLWDSTARLETRPDLW